MSVFSTDKRRIHRLTRAALTSMPDGVERFWCHLRDAYKAAFEVAKESGFVELKKSDHESKMKELSIP